MAHIMSKNRCLISKPKCFNNRPILYHLLFIKFLGTECFISLSITWTDFTWIFKNNFIILIISVRMLWLNYFSEIEWTLILEKLLSLYLSFIIMIMIAETNCIKSKNQCLTFEQLQHLKDQDMNGFTVLWNRSLVCSLFIYNNLLSEKILEPIFKTLSILHKFSYYLSAVSTFNTLHDMMK